MKSKQVENISFGSEEIVLLFQKANNIYKSLEMIIILDTINSQLRTESDDIAQKHALTTVNVFLISLIKSFNLRFFINSKNVVLMYKENVLISRRPIIDSLNKTIVKEIRTFVKMLSTNADFTTFVISYIQKNYQNALHAVQIAANVKVTLSAIDNKIVIEDKLTKSFIKMDILQAIIIDKKEEIYRISALQDLLD